MKKMAVSSCTIFFISFLVLSIFKASLGQPPNEDSKNNNQNIGTCEIDRFKKTIQEFKKGGLNEFINEICFILSAREKYERVSHSLMHSRIAFYRKNRNEPRKAAPVANIDKAILNEIRTDIQKAIQGFSTKKKGVINIPNKLIGQLIHADNILARIEEGTKFDEGSEYGYDVDIVDQRLGLALRYSLIWAKEGFK